MVLSSLLSLALLVPVAYAGMYGQPVVHLDARTFKTAMATEHAAMVAFVAPWCGHCKNLGPEYTAAAQSLSPLIPFYAVDCDDSKNKGLCAEYHIQGFPTIKAFPRAGKGAARDYQGDRKKGPLVEYAKTLVPDRVKKLRADAGVQDVLQKFLDEKPTIPHALLVHPSQPSIPFLWKVLGHRLSNKMHLGYIRDTTTHSVLSALGVYNSSDTSRDTARAVVWQPGADRASLVEYDGALKFNALLEFLQNQLEKPSTPPPTSQQPNNAPEARQAKLDEAEKRDRERREKLALNASKVEDAPEPQAAEGVSDESLVEDETTEGVAEPVPEAEASESEVVPEETEGSSVVHEEL
ncbi:thioredoxin-like protein [Naematelia encephala]|uniref:Thioredoxin-like protein n=1 Tax=Naematelia encephala TaxID=71784 RepID=A0A1Y2AQ59_9TREE|nr:thioredoxin-like protein [Naematelia encephala]